MSVNAIHASASLRSAYRTHVLVCKDFLHTTPHVHIPHVSYHIVFHIRSYRLRIIVQHTRHTHAQRANVRTLTQHSSSDSTGQNPESILHFHDVGSNLTYRITISDTHGANETGFLLYGVAKKIVYNPLLIYMSFTYLYVTKNFLQYFFLQHKI